MTRDTSIEAYRKIKEEGLLSKLRFSVYECLYQHGPMTQGEVWSRYFHHRQRHDIGPRFAELLKRGVIKNVAYRPCTLTGNVSMVWDVTSNLPSEPIKTISKREQEKREAYEKGYRDGVMACTSHPKSEDLLIGQRKLFEESHR